MKIRSIDAVGLSYPLGIEKYKGATPPCISPTSVDDVGDRE